VSAAHDPLEAINAVLSEVIDFVSEVKQARWRFPAPEALHAELDSLFDDIRSWVQLLIEEDDAHGLSPLGSMPSASGRRPPTLGPEAATADGVRLVLEDHLARLDKHVAEAVGQQVDEDLRSALGQVEAGARRHVEALRAL
jgi:hypothetical protein